MPRKVVQIKNIGIVTFSQNNRSKNIKISVKPDKSVLVSFPFYVSGSEALSFLSKNADWINRQQQKMNEKNNHPKNGKIILTKQHTVLFVKAGKSRAEKNGHEIKIFVDDFHSPHNLQFIEKILIEVYRYEAQILLPGKLNELAQKHGFGYNRLTIRNNKRNWGSCSSKNNISLNLQMMKLPDNLIEYILLHELVHTEIKNHSKQFWDRLNGITNNRSRELAKQVRQYSTYTL